MEDRAIERLNDLYDYWMPQVTDTAVYPVDCVFTTDEEWEAYKQMLADSCGMDQLLQVYQDAYARYTSES